MNLRSLTTFLIGHQSQQTTYFQLIALLIRLLVLQLYISLSTPALIIVIVIIALRCILRHCHHPSSLHTEAKAALTLFHSSCYLKNKIKVTDLATLAIIGSVENKRVLVSLQPRNKLEVR